MSTKLESISPVSGEVVWSGTSAGPADVADAMKRASDAFDAWRATPVEQRIETVRRYGEYMQQHRDELASLISREVGKLAWDANAEVGAAIAKVELSIQAMLQRRSDKVVSESDENLPSAESTVRVVRRVRHQPLGVVLVLGPFNFPVHLPGGQIIPALLAGNTVVLKPSDQATATGEWMFNAWKHAGLPEGVMQLIPGGVETAVAAIDSPLVSGVFLTGSREAGRAIHRQLAGRFDVVLALELGGNNPIVVLEDASSEDVGTIVSFASFVSSGQRCTCARRAIFVEGDATDRQIESVLTRTNALRIGMPGSDPPPHLGPMISTAAAERLRETYDRLIGLGCEVVIPFQSDSTHGNLVRPSVLDASSLDLEARDELGQLEWFGPMLVIQRVSSFEGAVETAAQTSY